MACVVASFGVAESGTKSNGLNNKTKGVVTIGKPYSMYRYGSRTIMGVLQLRDSYSLYSYGILIGMDGSLTIQTL